MSRSLMRHNIAELEQLFHALKTDPKTLKALEEELRHRQVPRAVALLAKVQGSLNILKGTRSGSSPGTVPTPTIHLVTKDLNQQPDLWSRQSTRVLQIAPKQVVAQQEGIKPANSSGPPPLEASALAGGAGNTHNTHGISIDEAYKILKATSCSTWEIVEQTRRQVVQQSHPERVATLGPERRAHAEAEAKRANAAYSVLCRLRTSRSDDL